MTKINRFQSANAAKKQAKPRNTISGVPNIRSSKGTNVIAIIISAKIRHIPSENKLRFHGFHFENARSS